MERIKIKNKFKDLLELQDTFNSALDVNWKEKSTDEFDYASCILVESGESLDSIQFKHWKKQELDMANFGVETIDKLHFIMSQHLGKYSDSFLSEVYTDEYENSMDTVNDVIFDGLSETQSLKKNVKILTMFALQYDLGEQSEEDLRLTIRHLFHNMDLMEWDINTIYANYVVKNCLNKVRQDRGYKKGTYIKDWIYGDNVVEDNVVAYEIMDKILNFDTRIDDVVHSNEIIPNESNFDKLYRRLISYYDDVVVPDLLSKESKELLN